MSRNSIIMIVVLTVVWIILRESLTVVTAVVGLAISTGCVILSRRVIPLARTERIKPLWLFIYLFYLLGQIFLGGIATIRIILFGAHVEIVKFKTQLRGKFLRTLLVNSITLVPGSVSLDLVDDTITVLWLMRKTKEPPDVENAGELLKGKLERMLIRAEK
jgi:multicomponent Na+:H+ antiporter subunit E